MEILVLIKDLLGNKELLGVFLFSFIALSLIFKKPLIVAKTLRKIYIVFVIVNLITFTIWNVNILGN